MSVTVSNLSLSSTSRSRPVQSLDDTEQLNTVTPSTQHHQQYSESPASVDIEESDCKYNEFELLHTRTPLLTGTDVESKREEIRNYFHQTFSLYEKLFDVLASDQTYYMQPEKLRHPLIFYAGHTAVFFINKLRLAGLLSDRINESMESTLAVGVDEMSWDDLNCGNYVWPSVDEVHKYRDMCRVVVDDLISSLPLTLPITWESPFWVILMGCEHERIHLETSSVLFRQLPIDQVKPLPMWQHCQQFRDRLEDVPKNELIQVTAGTVQMGTDTEKSPVYHWDNEMGTLTSEIGEFAASKFLVSNGEFYEFVADGGYEDESLWGEEGWKFVQFRQARHPVFWVPTQEEARPAERVEQDSLLRTKLATPTRTPPTPSGFQYRTMTAIIPMPWDWPVDCNYIEAKAFCAWKNRRMERDGTAVPGKMIRMPSEAEYNRLRDYAFPEYEHDTDGRVIRHNDQPYWPTAPGNINLEHGASSCPIDRFQFRHGFHDIVGNVWQWSETPIMPLRGFKFHPLYDDFSVPTFDTRHNIFNGGSWASTGNEAVRTARYAFRRHFYQHAGFRYILAEPLKETIATASMCETDPAVTATMDAQYNDLALEKFQRSLGLPPIVNFSVRIAEFAIQAYKRHGRTETAPIPSSSFECDSSQTTSLTSAGPRAIDIGCACGRSTFELAKLAANTATSSSSPSPSSSPPSSPSSTSPLFDHILGLDFSTRFIRLAAQLQFDGHVEYQMKKEGDLISYHSIESTSVLDPTTVTRSSTDETVYLDLDLKSRAMLDRVEFMQGDACNLGTKYTGYDLVLASNLLEYLYEPLLFLNMIHTRMRRGGILVLASSYSWDESFTPKSHWLGGIKDASGESIESARAVTEMLNANGLELVEEPIELPIIARQSARAVQIKFAQVMVWRKK